MWLHPGEFAHFFENNANARELATGGGGGMGTAGIDWCITALQIIFDEAIFKWLTVKTQKPINQSKNFIKWF